MSPGYDRRDHFGFRRRVTYSCMFCHNANPEIAADSDASGKEPLFPGKIPLGIDCQRCHGPGRDHVGAFKNKRPIEEARAAILNPAKLNPQRQLDVCLQCHLESSTQPLPATIRRYDRNAFSYRPGEPLESYALHFDRASGPFLRRRRKRVPRLHPRGVHDPYAHSAEYFESRSGRYVKRTALRRPA